MFKKLNWVQWLIITMLIAFTVFFAFLFYRFGTLYNIYRDLGGNNIMPAEVIYRRYLIFSIISYIALTALHTLLFIREFKRNVKDC